MTFKSFLIGQRIALSFSVTIAALGAIGILSFRNLDDMQREAESVTHTVRVLAELRQFNDSISRLESAGRGYLLAGDQRLKDDLAIQKTNGGNSLRRLRALTEGNSKQLSQINELERLLVQRSQLAEGLAAVRDRGASSDAPEVPGLVLDGQGASGAVRAAIEALNVDQTALLASRQEASRRASALARDTVIWGSLCAFVVIVASGVILVRSITTPLSQLRQSAVRIGDGDYGHRVNVTTDDEVGHLGTVFNQMAAQVQQRQEALAAGDWLKTSLAGFSDLFQQQHDPVVVANSVLSELATLIDAQRSALYRVQSQEEGAGSLVLSAAFAAVNPPARVAVGEGLVGQCCASQRRVVLDGTPPDYLRVTSALGETKPAMVVIEPVRFEGKVKAVLELASLKRFTPLQLEFVERLADNLGVVLHNIESVSRTEELLRQSQALALQLEGQQRVLAGKNTELEAQTERLRTSEQLLQEQQVELTQTNEELEQSNEEMEQANEELEEKSNLLATQKRELEGSNRVVEQARAELEEQARQLAISSAYKSNFLATMSHELRTPLNSLLILSRLLGENRDGNLSEKQVQFAHTIESSGSDLLEMINQILDLAKIESGTVELQLNDVKPEELERALHQQFHHVAETKNLSFELTVAEDLPERIHTDIGRLHQVLKNLLANAFKFTERGSVSVDIRRATSGWPRSMATLNNAETVVAIAVKDTGIGIPQEKQEIIFESFQQADAGTARRFGGTGLGLSISREISAMLGGVLQLESDVGNGSTFTLFLPAKLDPASVRRVRPEQPGNIASPSKTTAVSSPANSGHAQPEMLEIEQPTIEDDRDTIVPSDRVLLVIEDDPRFAAILRDFAREKRFKALVAAGARQGLALAQRFLPVAITLDLRLVDEDGWMVLDRLKHDERTRHIPVHVISVDPGRSRGLRQGAVSYLQKPVSKEAIDEILQQTVEFIERPVKNLLVVEDDAVQRESIRELIGNNDVHTTAVATASEALAAIERERYDCVVIDLMLPDRSGAELIREINRRLGAKAPPVIVYTGKELSPREETELRSLSETIIVKDARSPERLLDETALFLHRVQSRLPESKRRMLEQVRKQDAVLTGRRALIVDDDVRNIFALTAALESYGMVVAFAESGRTAIETLRADPTYDVVLMDVMMPEMDGNEAMRILRQDSRFAKLPIIAVTAKAMKGDRERSIDAGASDYIAKPVDTEKLISLLRVWLYR